MSNPFITLLRSGAIHRSWRGCPYSRTARNFYRGSYWTSWTSVSVKNLDAGEGDFLSKLKVQLSEGSPDCRQLMAESLWLTLLFPSNVGAAKKRENVLEIWSWSGEDLNATHPLLADGVLEGIGSAGTAYNTHRWRELVFLIGALRDFTARDGSEREQ